MSSKVKILEVMHFYYCRIMSSNVRIIGLGDKRRNGGVLNDNEQQGENCLELDQYCGS
jgi:hypothetical protein